MVSCGPIKNGSLDAFVSHFKDNVFASGTTLDRCRGDRELIPDDLDLPLLSDSRPRLVPGCPIGDGKGVALNSSARSASVD